MNVNNGYKCSHTEYEGEAFKWNVGNFTYVTASTKRRDELDAEIAELEAEIASARIKRTDSNAVKIKRSAELCAEITALEAEITKAKTKRNIKLAAMDAKITALEAQLAAIKT